MASIEDIRVNSQNSSATVSPVVAGFNPVITWEYDADAASTGQASVEIRIGTSTTNWGANLFAGSIVDVDEENTGGSYEIEGNDLSRGTTYYGQIRGTDGNGTTTAWSQFQFDVNQLPFVTSFILTPTSPNIGDDIDLTYTFHDPDGHDQSGTKIRWFKNNLPITRYDGLCTLPSSATSAGESWTAKIIPSDGIEFGAVVETSSVTIAEGDSGFDSVSILPVDANVDDILKVEWVLSDSEYAALNGTVVIEWYLNGTAVSNSNSQFIRLDLDPGDVVYVIVKIVDNEIEIASITSDSLTISDVQWHVFDLEISGLTDAENIANLDPILDWKVHKTTADKNDKPLYFQVLITKTPSRDGPIFDTGVIEYTKDSYAVQEGTLSRGQRYYVHVGVSDSTTIGDDQYVSKEMSTAGSSWETNVNNETGWTIEFNVAVAPGQTVASTDPEPNLGVYVHDGTYFCTVTLGLENITFLSGETVTYPISTGPNLSIPKTIKIAGKDTDVKIFMNNTLIIDAQGALTNQSQLKRIEFGDIDAKNTNYGTFRFFRYSTDGAYGLDSTLDDENTFYFSSIGTIAGGSIDYVEGDIISWLPDDTSESAKLIKFNSNSTQVRLPTVTKNFSPITRIFIDENRNKYIGTANGVSAVYGEKHDPDYMFDTSASDVTILASDFDRITNVTSDNLAASEPDLKSGWFTLDTTYRAVGVPDPTDLIPTGDEYNPYIPNTTSTAVQYYSQRTHGHAWFDNVSNEDGWQARFFFDLDLLEADEFEESNTQKQGFGVYVNDGKYQEILYFYEDRIRLFYANVYVPISTTVPRQYAIVGKGQNLKIYQTLSSSATGGFNLLLDASGMFTTPAAKTGNSRKPKIFLDNNSIYHATWHDDSNGQSQIFYNTYAGNAWSTPEPVETVQNFNVRNPQIAVDSQGRAWVVYEDTSFGQTEISVSVKDSAGWNPKVRITNHRSNKSRPAIVIDTFDNVHVAWEDDRNGLWQILWAQWNADDQAWVSSGQFGQDTVIMQIDESDPYQDIMEFKNAQLTFTHPYVWVVCEAHFKDDNQSAILLGSRNIEGGFWQSSGTPITNDAGEVVSFGTSITLSNYGKNCFNPTIASNAARNTIVIAWEDRTEPVTQIWGAVRTTLGTEVVEVSQITSQAEDCRNPSAGFVSNQCVIVFEKNNSIFLSHYNTFSQEFRGSATGGDDVVIDLDDGKRASNPAVMPFTTAKSFILLYDYSTERTASDLSTTEFPDFQLIGDAVVQHAELTSFGPISSTDTISNGRVSEIDTKEFAFGDFSDNVGMLAHWKDIEMYFGYDAAPHSIAKFNANTVANWPDDRINDLFVDTYGNLIVATFGGLLYHNVFTGEITNIQGLDEDGSPLLSGKLITAVKWGGNGIWYVGTTQGLFYSKTAGKIWAELNSNELGGKVINSIAINAKGQAVCAVTSAGMTFDPESDGIYIAHPDIQEPTFIKTDYDIKVAAVDENNVIWAGSDSGLIRIENESPDNKLLFNRNNGMRSSHVNDIAIVNKHLRFIATASGVERMNGMKFTSFNTKNEDILNDNISSIYYYTPTSSLWIGTLYSLHEIVFRDVVYDIIDNEVVQYDNLEISTEQVYDKSIYFVLDFDFVQMDETITLSADSASVYVNRNLVEFGYTVDESAQSILFSTDMLVNDQVEIEISNRFLEFHDFNQTDIEKEVKGELRRSIEKMDRTDKGQLLLLSDLDRPEILLFNDQQLTNLPFTTVMLDRDLPFGCMEKLTDVTRTVLRFRILAFDDLSGLDGIMLSNYENFTSDGTTPLEFGPVATTIEHDIGEGINNVSDSLSFPSTVTIDATTYTVGYGRAIGKWKDETSTTEYLYAATGEPAVIFRYDPVEDKWTGIAALDSGDSGRTVNEIKTFFNILFITTGTDSVGGTGAIYKSVDGLNFDLVGSVTGSHARGLAAGADGTIYFGSSDGKIYQLKNEIFSVKYQNIGQSIRSLDTFSNTLIVATGNQGRVYTINTETDDNLIIFDGPEDVINEVHIKDSDIVASPDQAFLFAGSSESTTIYRSNLDTFDFARSYSSFGKDITRIRTVDNSALEEQTSTQDDSTVGTTVVSSIGTNMFKNTFPAWEFFYQHSEDIEDFIQYFSSGIEAIWIVSDSKVTRWTAELTTKTVYMRLKDKAGNISSQPVTDPACPTTGVTQCCNFAYSINIADLKNFVNESRIIDITEYGEIVFTYDSPNNRTFFSADQIDEEVGVYTSEVFNGSNDIVSWKTITWEATTPSGTSVNLQIRSGVTEDDALDATWSSNLVKGSNDLVSLETITDQYIQFRAVLSSTVRDLSPTLTSVTLRNLTAQASHFFTTNFVLPSRPIKGLLTANTFIPVSSDIVFGVTTNNSADFGDYQVIEPNRLFTTAQGQFGSNLRIGAKLLSPGLPQLVPTNQPGDPYDASSFVCTIDFTYTNLDTSSLNYDFRIRFYNDPFRTQLIHTFYSGNDQTGWTTGGSSNVFPAGGLSIGAGDSANVAFTPGTTVATSQKWYVTVDAWNGTFFETVTDNQSYICATCNLTNEPGLIGEYYKTGLSSVSEVPDFSLLTPDHVCIESSIDFPLTTAAWESTGCGTLAGYEDSFAARFRGRIQAPVEGEYTFILSSDDGSVLFIDGVEIVNMNQLQTFTATAATVELTSGFHEIEIHFFEGGGDAGLNLSWIVPGEASATTVPASRLYHVVTSEYCEDLDNPRILNFAVLFELENGETVKVNLGT